MAGQWYYRDGAGRKHGPLPAEELKRRAACGELRPDDKVWKEGKRKWTSARKVQRLFDDAPAVAAAAPLLAGASSGQASQGEPTAVPPPGDRRSAPASPGSGGPPPPEPVPLPEAARLEQAWLSAAGRSGGAPARAFALLARRTDELQLAGALAPADAETAAGSNAALREIARTLSELGFTREGAVEWLARQEKLHADYYDTLRRQKEVKTLLGQIEQYRQMTDGLYDLVARAYGARLLLETLERHRFSSRDLADAGDRDTFNDQLAWAGDTFNELPPEAHADLVNFEKAYGTYHWLKRCDPESDLRALKQDAEAASKTAVPPPPVPSRGLGSFAILFVTTLIWTALLVMVCVIGAAERDPPPGGYFYFLLFMDGFPVTVTLTVFLIAHRKYRRAMRQYRADREAYNKQRSAAIREHRETRGRIQARNDAIDKLIPGVRENHAAALSRLRALLNEFIATHPQLSTFVYPVG